MNAGAQMQEVGQEAGVSMYVVRSLVEMAERAGVARASLLSTAGLEAGSLRDPSSPLPRSDVYRLCEVSLDATGDTTLGLRYGDTLPDQALNVVSHLVLYAPTLRQALDALFRFSKLLTDEPGFRLCETGDALAVRCLKPRGASLRVERLLTEMTMAGIHRLFRSYCPTARASQLRFNYPPPAYASEYARAFGTSALFDQPHTEMLFDRALLDWASPRRDEDLHNTLRAVAERQLMRVTHRTPYSVRVREIMLEQGAPHRVSMGQVADQLELSVRSLRRRLSEEGTSYGEVTHSASRAIATQLIAEQGLTIQQTAYAMGFTDVSAFHRAFKRWTGTTPTDFRQRNRLAAIATPV